ncbi:unnamed protein product [Cyprideis torosa]|uniref:Uncharacterized protein n=1 Tax=Cyprideis torosa TaxID=163714 RepID=A0A7R8WMA8_9CRUS|nr:unnamed protein product [Cyprideis torosa]CAG0898235.1 unnamed protein product [Cyprideis torosa]
MLKAARGFNARIFVLGLLPRGDSDPDLVRACDKVLIDLCRQENVRFISLLDKIQEADMDGIASGSVHIIRRGALKILKTFHPMFQEFPPSFTSEQRLFDRRKSCCSSHDAIVHRERRQLFTNLGRKANPVHLVFLQTPVVYFVLSLVVKDTEAEEADSTSTIGEMKEHSSRKQNLSVVRTHTVKL